MIRRDRLINLLLHSPGLGGFCGAKLKHLTFRLSIIKDTPIKKVDFPSS